MIKEILILGVFFILIYLIVYLSNKNKRANEEDNDKRDLSVYEKKQYLFDTNSEFHLYKILIELFGEKYFIFPQVNYSHLIQVKKTSDWTEERKNRNSIDRKSADFVVCDKEKVVPCLVIELDGGIHESDKKKKDRDVFINELTKIVGLPILHIKNSDVNIEFVRSEVTKMLDK